MRIGRITPDELAQGAAGLDYYTSAEGARTGNWGIVEILEDSTTFTTLTVANNDGNGTKALTTRTWKRGDVIFGTISAITVSAGEVIAYRSQFPAQEQ